MVDQQADPVARWFREAERQHRAGNVAEACRNVVLGLSGDQGLAGAPPALPDYEALYREVPRLALRLASPQRAGCLAGFLTVLGQKDLAGTMLSRYLELSPAAEDRDAARAHLWLREALGFETAGDRTSATASLVRLLALGPPPADPLLAHLGRMLASENPGVVVGLANLLLGRGFRWEARLLFARYVSLAPDVVDHEGAFDMLDRLSAEHLLNLAIGQEEVKQYTQVDRLLRRALSHDPGPERLSLASLGPDLLAPAAIEAVLGQVRHPSTVYCLQALCGLRGAAGSAALCNTWLRPYEAAA